MGDLLEINKSINKYNSKIYNNDKLKTEEYKIKEINNVNCNNFYKKLYEASEKKKKLKANYKNDKNIDITIFRLDKLIDSTIYYINKNCIQQQC